MLYIDIYFWKKIQKERDNMKHKPGALRSSYYWLSDKISFSFNREYCSRRRKSHKINVSSHWKNSNQ